MKIVDDGWKPNWQNQIRAARRYLAEDGLENLRRHAMVSIRHDCRCKQCFCCAARVVYDEETGFLKRRGK